MEKTGNTFPVMRAGELCPVNSVSDSKGTCKSGESPGGHGTKVHHGWVQSERQVGLKYNLRIDDRLLQSEKHTGS